MFYISGQQIELLHHIKGNQQCYVREAEPKKMIQLFRD